MPDTADRDERIQQALQLLIAEVRERIDRHPLGHLVAGRGEQIDLRLTLPTALRDGQLGRAGRDAAESLQEAVQTLLHHSALFQPGRVLCLRCQTATCEHSAPADSRQVFTGWGPAGLPRFADFGQWLLQRRDPRVDLLYKDSPQLLAVVVPEAELAGNLIPAFRQREDSYRIHAQITAGWYRAPDPVGNPHPFAVSLQIVSTRAGRHRRRFGVNVVGIGPGGEPLENLFDKIGQIPWGEAVHWAQGVLVGIEGQMERQPRMGRQPSEAVEKRIEGLANAVARRLEK
ncbi:MAG TPA: hypothetical protein VIJ02_02545, partial [Thermoanaerobaculia bacterium]